MALQRRYYSYSRSIFTLIAAAATGSLTAGSAAAAFCSATGAVQDQRGAQPALLGAPDQSVKAVLNPKQIEFSADRLSYDPETGILTASGDVTALKDGYRLSAGSIIYDENTGQIIAAQGVIVTDPDGNKILSPSATLEKNLKNVLVENIRLILTDGSQVAAQKAARDGDAKITELDRAVYSPCSVVNADGSPKNPLWQIKAVKVTHDGNKRRLYYDNARLEFLGVPVLWLPFFSHPDPTVDRASGLLPPSIRHSRELGIVIETPYHFVLSKSNDITLTPIVTSKEGVVLGAEYRQKFQRAGFTTEGSITSTEARNDLNQKTGSDDIRGHFGANGYVDHSKSWRSRVDLNWASDDTYLRRYGFSEVDSLKSEYAFEGFSKRSYFGARAITFQGLRVEDIRGLTGYALPLIDAEFVAPWKPLGGTLSAKGNALALTRTNGLDTQRLSLSVGWTQRSIFNSGLVVDNDALIRADFYNISNADKPDDPAFGGIDGSQGRELARLSTTFSLPLIKVSGATRQIFEPIVQLVLAPSSGQAVDLVNEDSRAFELSSLNLFSPERAAGFDLWENGSRMTYGGKWRLKSGDLGVDVMLGHSWRFSGQNRFFAGSGIEDNASDFVARGTLAWKDWLSLESRIRLDQNTGAIRRNEIFAKATQKTWGVSLGYLNIDRDLTLINREDREELRGSGFIKIDQNWKLESHIVQDLSNGWDGVEYGVGATYTDECFEISLQFRESFTSDRDIRPGTSFLFRIRLKNLG